MTAISEPRTVGAAYPRRVPGNIVVKWLTSTDHKVIGYLYLITSFCFFGIGGLLALLMRAELARPGLQFLTNEQFNQAFTMHGTIMLLMFATPLFIGFANVIMPLQIGAPDVAFPRLNMFSYWLFLFGSLIAVSGFLTPQGAADFGWFAYAPLNDSIHSPGIGADMWIMGLALSGFGTILGGVNFITTIICMRAPGMTMFRMPIFTWNILLTAVLVLMAFPVLAAALFALEADRRLGAHIFESNNGGALLWQHLFWFFGHPEVYIVALPFFGIISEIIPVFSRKPIFGYNTLVMATLSIAGLSVTVWAHHMFTTGAVMLPFFAFMSYMIAVPTGIKFFDWIGTMWRGSLSFDTPMLWSVGFLVTFLFGGRALPLRALRHRGVRDERRLLLLVAEVHGQDAGRAAGQDPLLDPVRRLPHHVPGAALARRGGHAPALRGLPGLRRVHDAEHDLHDRVVRARRLDAAVPVQRVHHLQARQAGHRRRPVGLRPVDGVGHVLPAAAAQLHLAAAHPLGVPGVRPAPPGGRRPGPRPRPRQEGRRRPLRA